MDKENTKIIEINGVKMEVDMRTVRIIDNFRVGDNVKLLLKNYESYESHPGVIIGFDQFEKLPTIIIAYIDTRYSATRIKFSYFNEQSKDVEICKTNPLDLDIDKVSIINNFDNEILVKKEELRDLEMKRKYFLDNFKKHFVTEKDK